MGLPVIETKSERVTVHYTDRSQMPLMDTEHDRREGNLVRWWLGLSELDFEVISRTDAKHQEMDELSALPTTGVEKSTLENDVSVLKLTYPQPKGVKY